MNTNIERRKKRSRFTFLLLFSLLFSGSSIKSKKEIHFNEHFTFDEFKSIIEIKANALAEKETLEIDTVSIYLNPSVQTWNSYANQLGTEAEHMNKIAELMYAKLLQYQFIDVEANLNYLSLSNSVKQSNQKKRDIHLALHSNAGGGSGFETYQKKADGFGQFLQEHFADTLPFSSRGVKDGNHLYEIKNATADHVALMEILFHDRLEEANYIVNHHEEIATELTNTLVLYIVNNYAKK